MHLLPQKVKYYRWRHSNHLRMNYDHSKYLYKIIAYYHHYILWQLCSAQTPQDTRCWMQDIDQKLPLYKLTGELIKMIIIMDILFHYHFFFLGYPSCHVEIDLHKQKYKCGYSSKVWLNFADYNNCPVSIFMTKSQMVQGGHLRYHLFHISGVICL